MRVLMPLPDRNFDSTEAAVTWRALRAGGHAVHFTAPDGAPAAPDPPMISGEGLDAWGWMPGPKKLRLFGLMLRADADARPARVVRRDGNYASARWPGDVRTFAARLCELLAESGPGGRGANAPVN